MKLWTAWVDYFATGEGVTYSAVIGYAEDEAGAKKLFEEKFGEYLTIGCKAKEGIVRNEITEFLFSKFLFSRLEKNKDNSGALSIHAEYHVNKS